MSDNKFIKRLKGEQTAKSVLEIKNESAKTSFANMPQGTSNAINVYSDHRGNATAVLEGTDIWKLSNSQFVVVPNAFGDGQDFTSTYTVAGSSLWVNATHTFDQPKIFTGATQWTLKLCGHSLLSSLSNTIGFSLIIKFGNAVTITKSFLVSESAFEFCKEFIIDFSESEQSAIKVANGDTMTVQLLCADATASATIYNGMTTLVAQQRRVDGEAVASDLHTFEDLEVEIADIADDLADHIADKNNPHEVTKAQVGLGNVDNTSDLNKPISTATQTALDLKADKSITYTKTETDTLLSGKQDTISDLATIRSGAALGATAVQPGDLATVATSGDYDDLSNKPTIPTVGNGTITITQGGISKGTFTTNQSGNTTIALDAGGGGIGNIDNLTITANADDEIQAVAVIDQNTGIAKTWTGTMAEYEAIVTKDPETEYIITDDIGGSATEIGEITEALNNKVDKGHQVVEFQEPTSANGYTWYRKYADGWVEQGGENAGTTINLPITMANADYTCVFAAGGRTGNGADISPYITLKNTTYIQLVLDRSVNINWQVSGMAA